MSEELATVFFNLSKRRKANDANGTRAHPVGDVSWRPRRFAVHSQPKAQSIVDDSLHVPPGAPDFPLKQLLDIRVDGQCRSHVIPTASTWDSCLLLVMPGLVPLLSGLAFMDRAHGLDSTGFRRVRWNRDLDRRPAHGPSSRHARTCSGHPLPPLPLHGRMDARNKSGHDGGGAFRRDGKRRDRSRCARPKSPPGFAQWLNRTAMDLFRASPSTVSVRPSGRMDARNKSGHDGRG